MKNSKIITLTNTACIATLVFISYCLTNNIQQHWDIIAADEISYLKFGKNILLEPRFDWGFLYNLWYKFLSLFQSNTVELYYLNYKVLISSIPILLFLCLLVYNINSIVAFIIAYLFLISKLHITTWPFVSDFCIILMLCFFIIISYIKDIAWKSVVLTFFTFLLYLTRPEYIIAFFIALCFSVYQNRNNKKRWIVLFAMIVFLIAIGGNTNKLAGIDRSFLAYAQHYIITYKIWNKDSTLDLYQYIALAPKIFGKSYTFLGSIIFNPVEAIRHVFTCIGFYLLTLVKSTEDFLLPSVWLQPIGKIKHLIFFCLLFCALLFYKKYKSGNFIKENKFLLFSMFIFFMAAAISNFIIGYNPHYFQLHFILYVLLFSKLLFSNFVIPSTNWTLVFVCLIFIALAPKIHKYPFQQVDYTEKNNSPIQKLAVILNEMNNKEKHCLLAYQTNIHFIVEGNNFSGVDVFSIDKPFIQFIIKKKVDYIYVNDQFKNDVRLIKDEEWKLFIANPEKYNFAKKEIINSKNYLLYKMVN